MPPKLLHRACLQVSGHLNEADAFLVIEQKEEENMGEKQLFAGFESDSQSQ